MSQTFSGHHFSGGDLHLTYRQGNGPRDETLILDIGTADLTKLRDSIEKELHRRATVPKQRSVYEDRGLIVLGE